MAHMHYKGTGKVHSFRGLLADGKQRKIRIQGPVGALAWRITKFQIMPNKPITSVSTSADLLVKIWREKQTSIPVSGAVVDFDDSELLATALLIYSQSVGYSYSDSVIFDNALFSRNIYVTHTDNDGSDGANYYIELEEVKLSKVGMAQLAVAAARRTID